MSHTEHTKRILIPIDEKENCWRAFEWYLENFVPNPIEQDIKQSKGKPSRKSSLERQQIIFLHVYSSLEHVRAFSDDDSVDASEMPVNDMKCMFKAAHDQAKGMLLRYEEKCKKMRVSCKERIELGTPTGKIICKVAEEEQVTSIVMGNRGLGPFRRAVLGSVTEYVIHHAKLPVLLVPPPKDHFSG